MFELHGKLLDLHAFGGSLEKGMNLMLVVLIIPKVNISSLSINLNFVLKISL
jgi:hypothetical protein